MYSTWRAAEPSRPRHLAARRAASARAASSSPRPPSSAPCTAAASWRARSPSIGQRSETHRRSSSKWNGWRLKYNRQVAARESQYRRGTVAQSRYRRAVQSQYRRAVQSQYRRVVQSQYRSHCIDL
eukprot:726494-Prorocentrum_minimum.AAC.1